MQKNTVAEMCIFPKLESTAGALPPLLPTGLPSHWRSRALEDQHRQQHGGRRQQHGGQRQRGGSRGQRGEEGPGALLGFDAVHLRAGGRQYQHTAAGLFNNKQHQ